MPSSLMEGMDAEEGSGGYVTPPVENSDPIPLQVRIRTVLEKAAEPTPLSSDSGAHALDPKMFSTRFN